MMDKNYEEIKNKLIQALANRFKLDISQLDAETELIEDLDFGSIQIIETALLLEDVFDIKVDTTELKVANFKSIDALIDMILKSMPDDKKKNKDIS